MVASKEHVARQLRETIEAREKWFKANKLPMDTLMNGRQKEAFLQACKQDFHKDPKQQRLLLRDAEEGKGNKHL